VDVFFFICKALYPTEVAIDKLKHKCYNVLIMKTDDRLRSYYPFDEGVIDTVSDAAERIASYDTYQDVLEATNVGEPTAYGLANGRRIELIDIRPAEHDPKAAMVVWLAMANGLDPNQRYQLSILAAANPDTRIIAAGNPGAPGHGANTLDRAQRKAVSGKGFNRFVPIVEPLMEYVDAQKIEALDHVGYSYGADLAATAAWQANHRVGNVITIEPVSSIDRNILKLALAFGRTGKALDGYVKTNELPTFEAARKDSPGLLTYSAGLARLSNIAIARGLGDGAFYSRMYDAIADHPEAHGTVAWGTESELVDQVELRYEVERLQNLNGRVDAMILPGQKHTLVNDLALQAAIVNQGLSRAR
jgi:pimeloyl-ACP methyl ester carboxylesterase